MSTVAVVVAFERVSDDNGNGVTVKADIGGENLVNAEQFDGCGDDAPPLPGDFVSLDDNAPGAGAHSVQGFADSKNTGKALGGEKRIYARDPDDGSVVCEIWLKGPGKISIEALKPGADIELSTAASGGDIILNGVKIDTAGNITAPGEVTAKAATTPVKLSSHLHPTGTGPSGPPQVGT